MMDILDRHERIALSLSGGRDSVACFYLLRPYLDRVTVYHLDTGDLLPETREVVKQIKASAPHFVSIRTDVRGWIAKNGLPSDLVPFGSHPIGRHIGQAKIPVAARYDCCFANVMWPLFERIRADGCTLLIRGTRRTDMPRLSTASGDCIDGIEVFHPIEDWGGQEVLDYLKTVGAPISRSYSHTDNSLDCARCTAWWSEGRGAYLKQYHPDLFEEYRAGMMSVWSALHDAATNLYTELAACNG